MFCQSCGTQTDDTSKPCPKCGTEPPQVRSDAAKDLGNQVRASSRDAFGVLRQLLVDPVAGLPTAFAQLGPERALSAGIALCIAFALAASGGVVMGASQVVQLAGPFGGFIGAPQGFGPFLKTTLEFLILPAAIATVSLAIRKMAGAPAPVAADIFSAGAALSPLGVALLLAGAIGVGNAEVVMLLLLFALVYLVLMLYAGFTRVGGMSERAGAPAVPAAILLAGWLCKVVFVAFV